MFISLTITFLSNILRVSLVIKGFYWHISVKRAYRQSQSLLPVSKVYLLAILYTKIRFLHKGDLEKFGNFADGKNCVFQILEVLTLIRLHSKVGFNNVVFSEKKAWLQNKAWSSGKRYANMKVTLWKVEINNYTGLVSVDFYYVLIDKDIYLWHKTRCVKTVKSIYNIKMKIIYSFCSHSINFFNILERKIFVSRFYSNVKL